MMSNMYVYVTVAISLLLILIVGIRRILGSLWAVVPSSKASRIANPVFDRGLISNPPQQEEVEFDTSKRTKVLKNGFSLDKIPKDLDAIVIGSGIGGLSVAALLAKTGKRILVLEQHDQSGGSCHVFAEKGFEFDVGIHYVGLMADGTVLRLLSDQLSNNRLRWEPLHEVYDILAIGDCYERKHHLISGRGVLMKSLIEKFPNDQKGITRFFSCLRESGRALAAVAMLKVLPKAFSRFLLSTGLLKWFYPGMIYLKKTLTDVLDELIVDEELKAILSYSFGDYGTPPNESPFFMQALLTNHYTDGAYYPRGGASEIAYSMIPTITSAGGSVLVRAKVTSILLDKTKSKAIGVKLLKGRTEYEVKAPMVISDAGVFNTYRRLLPPEILPRIGMDTILKQVKPGLGLFQVFIGLDGTAEELGLKPQNVWAFRSSKLDSVVQNYMSLSSDEARTADIPLLFLSFPSAKDPTFNTRYPGKTTCAIVTITPYKWFEEWTNETVMKRGEEYNSLKMEIGRRMWHQVLEMYPSLEDKVEYMDVGTPLSNQYYLNSMYGEVYGLDHDVARFDANVAIELRPETPIKGLYLTGQDMYCCGYGGAMIGGLLCASAILKRNLLGELQELRGYWKKEHIKRE